MGPAICIFRSYWASCTYCNILLSNGKIRIIYRGFGALSVSFLCAASRCEPVCWELACGADCGLGRVSVDEGRCSSCN